mgnify:CR=1 FL=1
MICQIAKASLSHQRCQLASVEEFIDRFGQICVSFTISCENCPYPWSHIFEVEAKRSRQKPRAFKAYNLQNSYPSLWPNYSHHLMHGFGKVDEVADPESYCGTYEMIVGKGQIMSVPDEVLNAMAKPPTIGFAQP